MRDDDFAGDRKADSGSGLGLTGNAIKPVKEPRQRLLRDAAPLVDDREFHESQRGRRRGEGDGAPGGRIFGRVGEEIDEDVAQPARVHVDLTQAGFLLHHQPLARRRDEEPRLVGHATHQLLDRDPPALERRGAGLQAGQVKQGVEYPEQAVGVVARRLEHLPLGRRQGAEALLEQEVNGHPEAGERSLELVADRADEIRLHVVQEAELGHVLEDDRGSLELRQLVADRQDPGKVMAILAPHPEAHHLGVVGRQVVLVGRQHGGQRFGQRRGQATRKLRQHRQFLRRRIPNLEPALPRKHEERVRGGRQRGFHRALGLQDASQCGLPVFPQARGHRVERLGQAAQLVAGEKGNPDVKPALAERHRRRGERLDRPKQRRREEPGIFLFIVFTISERFTHHARGSAQHVEMDQFHLAMQGELTPEAVGARPGNILVPVSNIHALYHLGNVLDRVKPGRRDVVVLHVRLLRRAASGEYELEAEQLFGSIEQQLFSQALSIAEKRGKTHRLAVVAASDLWDGILRARLWNPAPSCSVIRRRKLPKSKRYTSGKPGKNLVIPSRSSTWKFICQRR